MRGSTTSTAGGVVGLTNSCGSGGAAANNLTGRLHLTTTAGGVVGLTNSCGSGGAAANNLTGRLHLNFYLNIKFYILPLIFFVLLLQKKGNLKRSLIN